MGKQLFAIFSSLHFPLGERKNEQATQKELNSRGPRKEGGKGRKSIPPPPPKICCCSITVGATWEKEKEKKEAVFLDLDGFYDRYVTGRAFPPSLHSGAKVV